MEFIVTEENRNAQSGRRTYDEIVNSIADANDQYKELCGQRCIDCGCVICPDSQRCVECNRKLQIARTQESKREAEARGEKWLHRFWKKTKVPPSLKTKSEWLKQKRTLILNASPSAEIWLNGRTFPLYEITQTVEK